MLIKIILIIKMGCCQSTDKRQYERHGDTKTIIKTQFSWNVNQLQAKYFEIDGANIKLQSQKTMPHRICSLSSFSQDNNSIVKVRYVNFIGNGSFSIGVFHFEEAQDVRISKVGIQNVVRLYVSKNLGELKTEGKMIFHSEEWKTKQTDTIVLALNAERKVVEWRKQDTLEQITHKTELPSSFNDKKLFLELIVFEPETQLNVQVEQY